MTFKTLSPKQKRIFKWAHGADGKKYDCIICDGAIRSGKTICMIASFILWAMRFFNGATFGICGHTVGSCERNIILPMMSVVDLRQYYKISYRRSDHLLTVGNKRATNYFYIFGGKDESSQSLIQGITLSGVLLDEVALMPKSFVEQAIGRTLSVQGAKIWMNCNPENPQHFIKTEWIDDADGENRKKILHLHFLMSDNPILTPEQIEAAAAKFQGIFYERFILGEWTKPEGLVYPNFSRKNNVIAPFGLKDKSKAAFYVSMDYGTLNPCSMGLWAVLHDGKKEKYAIRIKEYYHNARLEGAGQLTDEEYYRELEKLCEGYEIQGITIDPSAASFITLVRKKGKFLVIEAKNDVLDGIRYTSDLITQRKILFCENCVDSIREFGLYVWDEKAQEDRPIKTDDHAMDDIRYFCYTIFRRVFTNTAKPRQTAQTKLMKGGWE